jgi:dTDP-4-amino-4,6-dideoxygalactose transaminase
MKIPLIDLSAQHTPLSAALHEAALRVIDSQVYVGGPEVAALERACEAWLGQPVAGTSSGTDALLAVLMALGIGPGDEVITTPLTFFATMGVILRVGATPVFADIDPQTWNIDPQAVERAITPRTRAILPVHLFGHMADMHALGAIAQAHGLPIIEDAAQAHGATLDGRLAGTWGLAGCFSFFPTKNLGALGDAGLVTSADAALLERIRLVCRQGAEPKYHHEVIGANLRLDPLQAALLAVKLPHLPAWNAVRQANAARYLDALRGHAAIQLPVTRSGFTHVYHHFCIQVDDRDGVAAQLNEQGVSTGVYYPEPLHTQPCVRHLGYTPGSMPVAERACKRLLALPVWPGMTLAQLDHVIDSLLKIMDAR